MHSTSSSEQSRRRELGLFLSSHRHVDHRISLYSSGPGQRHAFLAFTELAGYSPKPVLRERRRIRVLVGHLRHPRLAIRLRSLWCLWSLSGEKFERRSALIGNFRAGDRTQWEELTRDPDIKNLLPVFSRTNMAEMGSVLVGQTYILEAWRTRDFELVSPRRL